MKPIRIIFTRAFRLSWNRKKLLAAFIALAVCGLTATFCHVTTGNAWLNVGFLLLPLFLSPLILMPLGILLVRYYHDEVKRGRASTRETLKLSWELMIASASLMLPPLLLFLLLWAMLGLFTLLQELPGLHIVLSFVPFLLLLSCLVLLAGAFFLLFVAPGALGLSNRKEARKALGILSRLRKDPIGNLLFFGLALVPTVITLFFLFLTKALMFPVELTLVGQMAKNFVIMIPFVALLTFPVVFFFNMAAEAHAHLER
jgi:hypothetical protein